MPAEPFPVLAAVDIGNSSIRIALMSERNGQPTVQSIFTTLPDESNTEFVARLNNSADSRELAQIPWGVCSVNSEKRSVLKDVHDRWFQGSNWYDVTGCDSPFAINVDFPDRVGSDRIMSSVAAYQRSSRKNCVIVVDAGTAITVDLTAADGIFYGGAIAPGIGTQLNALARDASLLPRVALDIAHAPDALGKNTDAAIRAGVFWGTVGAIQSLLRQMVIKATRMGYPHPEIYMTGGAGELLSEHIGYSAHQFPHLVLEGVFYTALHKKWIVIAQESM